MTDPTSVLLEFDPAGNNLIAEDRPWTALSAVVQIGDTIWTANDETLCLERLSLAGGAASGVIRFASHRRFALGDFLNLPVPPDGSGQIEEADIEGLDYRDGYLWLVGSHSLKRKNLKKKDETDPIPEQLERLAKVSKDGNRYLLARIPMVQENGHYTLQKVASDGRRRQAARLGGNAKGNELTKALSKDSHLGRFLETPGKDNGFDIEGLAAADSGRVFIGLRGPVLRGWAVVLEVQLESDEDKPAKLRMGRINPRDPNNRDTPPYRKHFLQLGGLGVRELCLRGEDMLILAGPTMDLDGPVSVFRWEGGANPAGESVVRQGDRLKKLLDLPYGQGEDHAEGMSLFSADSGGRNHGVLIVYDSASPGRQNGARHAVYGDLFAIPGGG